MTAPGPDERPSQRWRPLWRRSVPVVHDNVVTLRELFVSDAPTLFAYVSGPDVLRYTATPPSSLEGFETFIQRSQRERRRGAQVCYGIVPASESSAMGLIQIRLRERGPNATAEWGFALRQSLWGTGIFIAAARLALDVAFSQLGIARMEARAAVTNQRGNAALRKLGATDEGTFRRGVPCADGCTDDRMWSILGEEWTLLQRLDRDVATTQSV